MQLLSNYPITLAEQLPIMRKNKPAVRSENLTVVFTDIVGFTETTAGQSREQNATLLHRHDKLLIPIAKKFGGRRVKSIGDALLLVFRSSTDALLCCMAMQDALYEHNQKFRSEPEIHIRTAVNVGEVRLVSGDVFGEAVNIAARLEGITPRDAIYLTKAVHMTMNRAEVPVEEVGMHRFKGVEDEIQIYQVPRFSSTKLVVDHPSAPGGTVGSPREGFGYPYGGAHLLDYQVHHDAGRGIPWRSPGVLWSALLVVLLAGGFAYLFWPQDGPAPPAAVAGGTASQPEPQPTLPPPPRPGAIRDRVASRLANRVEQARQIGQSGRIGDAVKRFKIQALMAEVWPWLLDERWYISPVRLKDAPLPLGSPRPDEQAGALPLQWRDLPGAEQVLFAALEESWDTLEPSVQHHLLITGKLWRGASPQQRRAVIAEAREWRTVEGVERTIASRRLDYLRGLESGKRWQVINAHQLALPLSGDDGAGPGHAAGTATAGVESGVEVRPPPMKSIWDRPPGLNSTPRTPDDYRNPRPDDRAYPPPPPPRGDDPNRPPRPPWERDDQRPPPRPPWERGARRPPPPR